MIRVCSLAVAAALAAGSIILTPESADARRGRQLTAQDRLYWEAAQALYGVGLKIKRSRRGTTIAPKPGGLTQAKYNRYVKVYLRVLRSFSAGLRGGYWRWLKGGYAGPRRRGPYGVKKPPNPWDPRGRVKRAHLILEPYLKYMLCRSIVGRIGSKPSLVAAYRRRSWCAWEAMQEAIAPIYVYRGRRVTWKAPQDKGDIDINHVIWRKDGQGNYPMVVTMRGGNKLYTLASTKILFKVSREVDADLAKKIHRKAKKLYKATVKKYRQLVKNIARKQRRAARGKKIIFGKHRFYATVLQKPTTGPLACKNFYYMLWGPRRKRREGYHVGTTVNGTECTAYTMGAGEVDRNDMGGFPCERYLKPGRNTVMVGVYLSHHSFNYKRQEWRYSMQRYRLQNVTYTKTRRGKKLYSRKITCTK